MGNKLLKNSAFWIVLSFIVWIIVFFGFLSSKLSIFEDAVAYYEHTKFFIESLAKGVYPLWDPYWYQGVPNDFFLRRLGAFNPFYFIILLFESIKIPYTLAYLWFLALYYWGGMIAFYLLAKRIYNNSLIAYAGYLMLMFSSLGTRLFDSYMMLITVPLIWFFYFLVAFTQTPGRHLFFGLCLSFMILASTYIPFYFLLFFAVFLMFFTVFYFQQIPQILRSYANFFAKNKILVILSFSIILVSFIPAVTFFHNSNKGQIVLPARHGNPEVGQALVVPLNTLDFGAMEDLLYSSYFSDFRMIRFAVVYIPFFAFIVFVLGLFCRISRRAAFLFVFGFVFFVSILPRGVPFYDFFYKYIFFLKYFRNLHFFLWFALIPLFIFLILEHWTIFRENLSKDVSRRRRQLIFVLVVHVIATLFIIYRADAILSTYMMLALSAAFWSLLVWNKLGEGRLAFAFLTVAILVQPIEVYHYLCQRAQPYKMHFSFYDTSFTSLTLKLHDPDPPTKDEVPIKGGGLYYASGPYNLFYQNMTNYETARYVQHAFILVDHLQTLDRKRVEFSLIEKLALSNENKAFIFDDERDKAKINSNDPNPSALGERISTEDQHFKILSFNANQLKLAVDLPYEKFLVYNDSYDPLWQVKVNGKSVHLYQTNVAFKGVWLPAGRSVVEFHYGHWDQYAMNSILLLSGFAFLFGIIWFRKRG